MTFLTMGSADMLPEEPADVCRGHDGGAVRFSHGVTVWTDELGNMCYLNATVQCLRAVPELRTSLKKYSGALMSSGANAPSQYITAALHVLYESMDKTSSSFLSIILLQFLLMAFPQFAEKDDQGQYVQQDANECWVQLMRVLQQKLETQEPEIPIQMSDCDGGTAASSTKKNFIDQFFGVVFDTSMKCMESEDEEPVVGLESNLQLSCFINQEVKYLATGIRLSKISRLPGYLTVQMVHFYYKESESVNAKVLKITMEMFEVRVTTFTGNPFNLLVDPGDTIGSVKERMQVLKKIPSVAAHGRHPPG